MKCKHCGEKIGRTAKFCRFCGQEIQQEKGKGLRWLIVGLVLAAVIVIIVAFIPRPVSDISGIEEKVQIKTGEQIVLQPELKPKRHKNAEAQYEIADRKIAEVTQNGTITGLNPGLTTLTIAAGDFSKTYDVEVFAKITEIKGIDKTIFIRRGEKLTLKPELMPKKYKNEKLEYIMEDKKVATVSTKGVITAQRTGKSKLTIKAGGCIFEATVKVTAPPGRTISPKQSTYPKSGGNLTRDNTYHNTPTQPPATSQPTTKYPSTTERSQPTLPEEIEDGEWL